MFEVRWSETWWIAYYAKCQDTPGRFLFGGFNVLKYRESCNTGEPGRTHTAPMWHSHWIGIDTPLMIPLECIYLACNAEKMNVGCRSEEEAWRRIFQYGRMFKKYSSFFEEFTSQVGGQGVVYGCRIHRAEWSVQPSFLCCCSIARLKSFHCLMWSFCVTKWTLWGLCSSGSRCFRYKCQCLVRSWKTLATDRNTQINNQMIFVHLPSFP